MNHWEPFRFSEVIYRLTIWFPEPELARSVLFDYLQAWVELPRASSAIFVVPRISAT